MNLGEQKQNGNMKIKEGKDEMSMTGYVYLVISNTCIETYKITCTFTYSCK
jgi:hypothetical protein